jgi:hypothetical protein
MGYENYKKGLNMKWAICKIVHNMYMWNILDKDNGNSQMLKQRGVTTHAHLIMLFYNWLLSNRKINCHFLYQYPQSSPWTNSGPCMGKPYVMYWTLSDCRWKNLWPLFSYTTIWKLLLKSDIDMCLTLWLTCAK